MGESCEDPRPIVLETGEGIGFLIQTEVVKTPTREGPGGGLGDMDEVFFLVVNTYRVGESRVHRLCSVQGYGRRRVFPQENKGSVGGYKPGFRVPDEQRGEDSR